MSSKNTTASSTSAQPSPLGNLSRVPSSLVAFPSVSQSLYTLSRATSLNNVAVHPASFAQRKTDSEAKLEAALNKNLASAQTRQVDEQERLRNAQRQQARLHLEERARQQRNNISPEPSSPDTPLTMNTRKSKTN